MKQFLRVFLKFWSVRFWIFIKLEMSCLDTVSIVLYIITHPRHVRVLILFTCEVCHAIGLDILNKRHQSCRAENRERRRERRSNGVFTAMFNANQWGSVDMCCWTRSFPAVLPRWWECTLIKRRDRGRWIRHFLTNLRRKSQIWTQSVFVVCGDVKKFWKTIKHQRNQNSNNTNGNVLYMFILGNLVRWWAPLDMKRWYGNCVGSIPGLGS